MFILQQIVAPPGQGQHVQPPPFQFFPEDGPQIQPPIQAPQPQVPVGDIFQPHQGQPVQGPGIGQLQRDNFLNFLETLLLSGVVNIDDLSIRVPANGRLNVPGVGEIPATDPNTGAQITANYLQNSIYRNDPEFQRRITLYRTQRETLQQRLQAEQANIRRDIENGSLDNKARALVIIIRELATNRNLENLSEEDRQFINTHLTEQERSQAGLQSLLQGHNHILEQIQTINNGRPVEERETNEQLIHSAARQLFIGRRLIRVQTEYMQEVTHGGNRFLIGPGELLDMRKGVYGRLGLHPIDSASNGGIDENEIIEGIARGSQALAPFIQRIYGNRVWTRGGTAWNRIQLNRSYNNFTRNLGTTFPNGVPSQIVQNHAARIAQEAERRALAGGASRQVAQQAGQTARANFLARAYSGGTIPTIPTTPTAPNPPAQTSRFRNLLYQISRPFRWMGRTLFLNPISNWYQGSRLQWMVNGLGGGGRLSRWCSNISSSLRTFGNWIAPRWGELWARNAAHGGLRSQVLIRALRTPGSASRAILGGSGRLLLRGGGFVLGRGLPVLGVATGVADAVGDFRAGMRTGQWGDFACTGGALALGVGAVLLGSNPIGWAALGTIGLFCLGGFIAKQLGVGRLLNNVFSAQTWRNIGSGIANGARAAGNWIAERGRSVGRFFGRLFGGG